MKDEEKRTEAEAPETVTAPEKGKTEPENRFSKINRKMTIIWSGIAVVLVLAIALILYFTAGSGDGGSGSAAEDGGIISSIFGGGKRASDQADDSEDPTELTEEAVARYESIGDSNKGSVSTDQSSKGETPTAPWTTLNDADYGIRIGTLATGYDGYYFEDGSDDEVKNVLAMQFFNDSDKDIQYAEYVFRSGDTAVSFKISDLPAGQSCVVLEANRHKYDKKEVLDLVSRVVAQVDDLPSSEDVLLVDNSDNTITIMNLTDHDLPVVRVFYKYFYEEQNTFLGGITYTATAEDIPAGDSVTVSPGHFESGVSILMGSGVYEKDN